MRFDRFYATILHQIFFSEEGMSAYDLSKVFGEWKRQAIRHRLQELEDENLLKKEGTKYKLRNNSIIYKGRIIEVRKNSVNVYYCPFNCDVFPDCGREGFCKFLEKIPEFKLAEKGKRNLQNEDNFKEEKEG